MLLVFARMLSYKLQMLQCNLHSQFPLAMPIGQITALHMANIKYNKTPVINPSTV